MALSESGGCVGKHDSTAARWMVEARRIRSDKFGEAADRHRTAPGIRLRRFVLDKWRVTPAGFVFDCHLIAAGLQ